MAALVSVVEVVAARIVKVDGEFDQAQTEQARVEVDVSIGVTGNRGDVVNSKEALRHATHDLT